MNNVEAGAIAVFAKTPGFSPIKTRLAQSVGKETAEKFHKISVEILKAKLRNVPGLIPYWAIAEEEALAAPLWSDVSVMWQGPGDLGARLDQVYSKLLQNHDFVILVGADCPHLLLESVAEAKRLLSGWDSYPAVGKFVIGRSQDGGFYLFGGDAHVPRSVWTSVSYSVAVTVRELAQKVARLGDLQFIADSFDVDTFEDLMNLQRVCLNDELLRFHFGDFFVDAFSRHRDAESNK